MTRKNMLGALTLSAAATAAMVMWGQAGPGSGEASAAAGKTQRFDGDLTVSGTLTAKALRLADGGAVATQKELADVKAQALNNAMDSMTKQLKTRSSSPAVSNFAGEIAEKVADALARKLASGSTTGPAGQLRKELAAMLQAELKRRGVTSDSRSTPPASELAPMKRAVDDLERKHKAAERKLDSLQREIDQLRRELKRK